MSKRRTNPKTRTAGKKTQSVGQSEGSSSDTSRSWTIAFPSDTEQGEFSDFLATHTEEARAFPSYTRDVTANPFFHPKYKRIEKLKGTAFQDDTYRWSKGNLRVVYSPDRARSIVWSLAINTATSIKYKKRSHR